MRPLVLVALALPALAANAQTAEIHGRVLDADGGPLPGANVYLSGTTRGAAAGTTGRFALSDLPPGAYRVVASMLGYEVGVEPVTLAAGDTLEVSFALTATVRGLGAVEVGAERDGRWARRYRWFREQLLGETENAAECEILNPHVLSFRGRLGTLVAEASQPLVIENRALGYRLTYDLETFEGSSASLRYHGDERFEELAPADSAEAARWAAARSRAYRGSMRHLFRSLLAGTAAEEGFTFTLTQSDPLGYRASFGMPERPVSGGRVIRTDDEGWGTLRTTGQLGVRYTREAEPDAYLESAWFREPRNRPEPYQRSRISLRRGERIDPQGTPEDPFALTVSGYLAFERLADLLPAEYADPAPRPASQAN